MSVVDLSKYKKLPDLGKSRREKLTEANQRKSHYVVQAAKNILTGMIVVERDLQNQVDKDYLTFMISAVNDNLAHLALIYRQSDGVLWGMRVGHPEGEPNAIVIEYEVKGNLANEVLTTLNSMNPAGQTMNIVRQSPEEGSTTPETTIEEPVDEEA